MRLIDASAYKAILKGWLSEMHAGEDEEENTEGTAIYSCICQLDDAPTVDAVVVTRCKNCIYFGVNKEVENVKQNHCARKNCKEARNACDTEWKICGKFYACC